MLEMDIGATCGLGFEHWFANIEMARKRPCSRFEGKDYLFTGSVNDLSYLRHWKVAKAGNKRICEAGKLYLLQLCLRWAREIGQFRNSRENRKSSHMC